MIETQTKIVLNKLKSKCNLPVILNEDNGGYVYEYLDKNKTELIKFGVLEDVRGPGYFFYLFRDRNKRPPLNNDENLEVDFKDFSIDFLLCRDLFIKCGIHKKYGVDTESKYPSQSINWNDKTIIKI